MQVAEIFYSLQLFVIPVKGLVAKPDIQRLRFLRGVYAEQSEVLAMTQKRPFCHCDESRFIGTTRQSRLWQQARKRESKDYASS